MSTSKSCDFVETILVDVPTVLVAARFSHYVHTNTFFAKFNRESLQWLKAKLTCDYYLNEKNDNETFTKSNEEECSDV